MLKLIIVLLHADMSKYVINRRDMYGIKDPMRSSVMKSLIGIVIYKTIHKIKY